MKRIIGIVALTLMGCSDAAPPPLPPTAGDFVRNDNGVCTAQVFGIQFHANANPSGASAEHAINKNYADPGRSSAWTRFTLGDDLTIQLDSVDESVVGFMINDQDYGTLNVGDRVAIDDERKVRVNGAPRSTNSVG